MRAHDQSVQAGLLTVVETYPGGAVVADTTQELERGYWWVEQKHRYFTASW